MLCSWAAHAGAARALTGPRAGQAAALVLGATNGQQV